MRMPFTEFFMNGDLKFIIVFILFMVIAINHFLKKLKAKKTGNHGLVDYHNTRINVVAFWILIFGVLSLILGLMHSFYFIGKTGGIAPNLIFQGVSYALITPVLGICLFIICKILKGIFNIKTVKS